MKKKCIVCEKEIICKRKTRKTCSDNCRKKLERRKNVEEDIRVSESGDSISIVGDGVVRVDCNVLSD